MANKRFLLESAVQAARDAFNAAVAKLGVGATLDPTDDEAAVSGKAVSKKSSQTSGMASYDPHFVDYVNSDNVTGVLKVLLPIDFADNDVVRFEVTVGNRFVGFEDDITQQAKILVGAWARSSNSSWDDNHAGKTVILGQNTFGKVRLGYDDTNGQPCILIGETTTEWRFPFISIDKAHSVQENDKLLSGYSTELTADISDVSGIIEPSYWKPDADTLDGFDSSYFIAKSDALSNFYEDQGQARVNSVYPEFAWHGNPGTGILKILLPYSDSDLGTNGPKVRFDLTVSQMLTENKGTAKVSTFGWMREPTNRWDVDFDGQTYIIGDAGFSTVRMAYDTNADQYCLLLGTTSTSWEYPFVSVDKVDSWHNASQLWKSGYSVEVISDETNLTAIREPEYWKPDAATLEGKTASEIAQTANSIPESFGNTALFGTSKSAGYLIEDSYSQILLNRLYRRMGLQTVIDSNVSPTNFSNPRCFSDNAQQVTGSGSYVEFTTFGESVTIFQAIRRTTDYAEFDIYVDGNLFGSYDNENHTVGSDSDSFTTDGSQRSFPLSHKDAYNISATLDGGSVTLDSNTFVAYMYDPTTGEKTKVLHFTTPPTSGQNLVISYDHGHVIAHDDAMRYESDGGDEVIESTNEYQDPYSYNDTLDQVRNLNSNVVDEGSAIHIPFNDAGSHTVKVEITGGTNPYFCFDFAVQGFYRFMNAAIGGWDLDNFLNPTYGNENRTYKAVRRLSNIENLIFEYGANDDRYRIDQVELRVVNMNKTTLLEQRLKDVTSIAYQSGDDTYDVGLCTATIDSITDTSITSSSLVGASVSVGDWVRIGRYYSSWREFEVREVSAFDDQAGTIEWEQPIYGDLFLHQDTIEDLVGEEFAVRTLNNVETEYSSSIDKVRAMIPSVKFLAVGQANYNVNEYCSAWGHNRLFRKLTAQKDEEFIPLAEELMRYEESQLTGEASQQHTITADGSTEYLVDSSVFGNINRAFKVMVGGENVLGKDCYVERLDGYYPDPTLNGAEFDFSGVNAGSARTDVSVDSYNNDGKDVKIVFYQNAPASGNIVFEWGKKGWTNDAVHPTNDGDRIFAEVISKAIK